MEALGLIETKGLTGLIEAADTVLKTAIVKIAGFEKSGSGIVTLKIRGSVADCRAALDAAVAAADSVGKVLSVQIIPFPDRETEKLPVNF